MNELKKSLQQLDIPPNAIKFYLESFQHGKATIGQIAKSTKMDRSSAYLAYEQLHEKNLVEEDLKSSKKYVWAASPKVVMREIRKNVRHFRKIYDDLEENLPELMAEYNDKETKPVLQFFSGKVAVRRISQDVLDSNVNLLRLFTNQNIEKDVFNKAEHEEFVRTRKQKGIKAIVLAANTPGAKKLKQSDDKNFRETRIISDLNPFKNETYIYGEKVAMLSFDKDIVGFVVQSKDFANSQAWMFDQIWAKHK
ncbi:TrmB family transcriptional regulator [Patescibacteria group bacterium]